MTDFKWSQAEKKVARRAFEAALAKECAALVSKFKETAATVQNTDDLWAIHDELARQRRTLDEKYDYRYSQLIVVFSRLLAERWIEDRDLAGLNEEKLRAIRYLTSL
jgi:hypothetical protein